MERDRPGWPLDGPALHIVDIEATLPWVVAVGVHRQLLAHREEVVPIPGLGRVVTGRIDALRFKDIGVVVDVRGHPAGADAVPAPFIRATLRFLGLDEVTWRAYDRVGRDLVGDVEQDAVAAVSLVAATAVEGSSIHVKLP